MEHATQDIPHNSKTYIYQHLNNPLKTREEEQESGAQGELEKWERVQNSAFTSGTLSKHFSVVNVWSGARLTKRPPPPLERITCLDFLTFVYIQIVSPFLSQCWCFLPSASEKICFSVITLGKIISRYIRGPLFYGLYEIISSVLPFFKVAHKFFCLFFQRGAEVKSECVFTELVLMPSGYKNVFGLICLSVGSRP